MALVGCEPSNEANAPQEGEVIELSFSMTSEMAEPLGMPARLVQDEPTLPGDPGKDDFIAPTHLYFVLWVQTTAGQKQMIAVKESSLSASDWQDEGRGIYSLKNRAYKFIIPKDGDNVQQLHDGLFYVFAYASTRDIATTLSFTEYSSFTAAEKSDGKQITNTDTELTTLQNLTYDIPGSVTSPDAKRNFFRSMYSTALSETGHNQMATSPTIRLRHTASRVDINWECDETIHTHGLTPGSRWTLATSSFPTSFSLFKPGENTGATTWSETITIDEGNRYNGRYVTYLPMPTTPTFTVTSSVDNLDDDSQSKTLDLDAGSDVNFATWMRALWTIR